MRARARQCSNSVTMATQPGCSGVGGRCGNVSLSTALQSKTPASLSMDPHRPAEQQAASRPQSCCALIHSLVCGRTCTHTPSVYRHLQKHTHSDTQGKNIHTQPRIMTSDQSEYETHPLTTYIDTCATKKMNVHASTNARSVKCIMRETPATSPLALSLTHTVTSTYQ